MIAHEQKRELTRIGEFTEKEFTIKASPKAFKILISNLYSDRIAAVLREIGINAVEANLENGKGDIPISITLPTHFTPILKIRDQGKGMSHNFMLNEFLQVFNSTKSNSNKYTGMFGCGRISSMSICDSFMVINFQNKIKRTYSIFYNEEGIPSCAFLGEETTEENDGCLIEIPCSPEDSEDFEQKAKEAYRFYTVKPKIEDNDNFTWIENKYLIESPNKNWFLAGSNEQPRCIMGQYCYKIEPDSITGLDNTQKQLLNSGIIMNFNIGEVSVQANREGLFYDKNTIESIKSKLNSIIPEIKPVILSNFDNKGTWERMKVFSDITNYKGKLASISDLCREFLIDLKIPSQLNLINFECHQFTYDQWKRRLKSYQLTSLHYQDNLELIYCSKKTHMKAKARKFLQEPSNNGKKMIFFCPLTTDAIDNFKKEYDIDILSFINSDTLPFDKAIKNVNPNPKKIRTMSFLGHNRYRRSNNWNEEEMNISDDIIYIQRSGYSINEDSKCRDFYRLAEMVTQLKTLTGNDIKVWGLGKNQIKKAGKNWKHIKDYYDEELARFHKQESENIEIFNYHHKHYAGFPQELLNKLDIDKSTLCSKIYQEYEEIKKKVDKIPSELVSQKNHGRISDKYAYNLKMLYENYPIIECLTDNAYSNSTRLKQNQKLELSQYINEKKA